MERGREGVEWEREGERERKVERERQREAESVCDNGLEWMRMFASFFTELMQRRLNEPAFLST